MQGCDPKRISENIRTLVSKGKSERDAIREAHAYAKQARKAETVVAPALPPMSEELV